MGSSVPDTPRIQQRDQSHTRVSTTNVATVLTEVGLYLRGSGSPDTPRDTDRSS